MTSRSLIAVSGEEATAFLQNLLTCDVENLATDRTAFGALLTPQGKILFDFLIHRTDDAFIFDVTSDQASDLAKRLTFYRLRAKVLIEPLEDAVHLVWPASGDSSRTDPRDARLGGRIIGAGDTSATQDEWDAWRIGLGFPECGKDFQPGDVFPHEALMDQFGASGVDFSKGCYVGQEVVSRMQHRGTARSRFLKVKSKDGEDLPAPGTPVEADGRTLGTMGSHSAAQGLALLRLDRTAKAMTAGQDIVANDIGLAVELPDFVTFDWPQ